jgi:hypothetical protein
MADEDEIARRGRDTGKNGRGGGFVRQVLEKIHRRDEAHAATRNIDAAHVAGDDIVARESRRRGFACVELEAKAGAALESAHAVIDRAAGAAAEVDERITSGRERLEVIRRRHSASQYVGRVKLAQCEI